jgi:hypothetical protein
MGFACAALAQNQHDGLIVGLDDPNASIRILRNSAWTELSGTIGAWGMTADNQSCTLWISAGFSLHKLQRGEVVPTHVADFTYDDGSGDPPFPLTLTGLAWSNGLLLGSRSPGSFSVPEGLYLVDTSTGECTLLWANPTTFDLGGLDADAVTGNLYGVSDPASGGFPFEPQGLYQISVGAGGGSATRITDYRPVSQWPGRGTTADVDGLAIGNGRAYMIVDEIGVIAIWNVAASAYETNIPAPWATATGVFSSGAWGPCFNLPACVADFDDGSGTGTRDGGVGIEDLLYYLEIYGAGTVAADVDDGSGTNTRDGGVGIEDLLYFLTRFDLGC